MSERRTKLEFWGTDEVERVWWKRGRDPIGRHTMIAAVLGVLLAALIGALFDPLNLQTADDLERAENAAWELAYAEIEASGYADGVPYGEVEHLGAEIVAARAGADSSYAQQFRVGWQAGWNDALDALRQSAEAEDIPPDYTEFRVLDQTARR